MDKMPKRGLHDGLQDKAPNPERDPSLKWAGANTKPGAEARNETGIIPVVGGGRVA